MFCYQTDGPVTRGEGGGSYERDFTVNKAEISPP